jgi:hypothetical protein
VLGGLGGLGGLGAAEGGGEEADRERVKEENDMLNVKC